MEHGRMNRPNGGSNLRILLVEDHPGLARLMGLALRSVGHDVRIAGGVGAALQLADEQRFDLLVSDLGLPDGTGLDLMRKLAERGPITGIAYSGYDDEEHVRATRDAGFAAHLKKPVELDELTDAIRRVLGGSVSPTSEDDSD
jgi:DNA-binding response OmpR family regulator